MGASSMPLVVSARSSQRDRLGQLRHQRGQIAPQQRLAAGEPKAVAPAVAKTRASRVVSSKSRMSSRGSQAYSASGMQ